MVYSTAKYGCSDIRKIPAYPLVVSYNYLALFDMNPDLSDYLFSALSFPLPCLTR
jgi:hypothetical protein